MIGGDDTDGPDGRAADDGGRGDDAGTDGGDEAQPRVRIVDPPHPVGRKVTGGGGPTPDMLARAEEAVAKMSDDYPDWASRDIEALEGCVARLSAGDASDCEAAREAFKLAHDMRGQGGSFGYPLMTQFANSFCRFTEKLGRFDDESLEILKTHTDAMRAVIANRVTGDGGTIGGQITEGLDEAVRKYVEKHGL